MPSAAFAASLPFVLRWEGGYVDHPNDPGGATNKGITQRVYDEWRQRHDDPPQKVRQISDADVHAIYEDNYWNPPCCDVLRRARALIQFDTAVNMGVGRAVRLLQQSVSCPVDGAFGPGTKKAADECDIGEAMIAYCEAREQFYRRLAERRPELNVFLKGWLNRLNALRQEVGLPGHEAAVELDFGETAYIKKIPDIGDPGFDF